MKGKKRKMISVENEGNLIKKGMQKYENKKAKLRKVRKIGAKITVGKVAADKKKNKQKYEEENVFDYEEDEEGKEVELPNEQKKEKLEEEKKMWTAGRMRVDPRGEINIQTARLLDPTSNLWDENNFLEYFLTFLPVDISFLPVLIYL